jgi:outer membrane translocation and assembly module TamA
VPLYNGKLIAGSGLEQQVIDALTAIATGQHLDAKVDLVPVVDMKTNQPVAESFRLVTPAVVLSTLTLDGVSPDQAAKLAPIVQAAAGQEYSLETSAETLTTAILNVYRNQGYLDARVTKINATTPSLTPDKVSVPMTATIDEGGQYRIGKLTLAGSVLMSQEEFQKKAVLRPGDIANQELLRRTLLSVSGPYRNKGYIRAKIAAVPKLDAATHVASYAIDVTPGDQFHLGRIELASVTDTQRAQFLQVWKMNAGDPYDESYTNNFLVVTFRKDAALQ